MLAKYLRGTVSIARMEPIPFDLSGVLLWNPDGVRFR
jgi:hypothetical protein